MLFQTGKNTDRCVLFLSRKGDLHFNAAARKLHAGDCTFPRRLDVVHFRQGTVSLTVFYCVTRMRSLKFLSDIPRSIRPTKIKHGSVFILKNHLYIVSFIAIRFAVL